MRVSTLLPRAACALLACGALLSGCEEEPLDEGLSCDLPDNGSVLEGDWTLRARGTRDTCEDRRLEGELSIATPMAIAVESTAQPTSGAASGPELQSEADAFVSRIERADYVLSLGSDAPSELRLGGQVVGACVAFTLSEELPDGDRLAYRFEGYIVSSSRIEGEFTGEGPEDCLSRGSFELTVR